MQAENIDLLPELFMAFQQWERLNQSSYTSHRLILDSDGSGYIESTTDSRCGCCRDEIDWAVDWNSIDEGLVKITDDIHRILNQTLTEST